MEIVGSSSSFLVLLKFWKILLVILWFLLGRIIMESKDFISGNYEVFCFL